MRLFLGSLGLGLVPGPLLPGTLVALVRPRVPELPVGTALDGLGHVALGDLGDGLRDGDGELGGEVLGGGDAGELRGLGLALLDGVGAAGEHDEAALVLLQAGDVEGERLLAEVLATVVDGNADGARVQLGDTGGLENGFCQSLFSSSRSFLCGCGVMEILLASLPSAHRE